MEILFEMGQRSIFAEVTLGSLIEQWELRQCMVALAVCSSPRCPSTGTPSSSCSKAETEEAESWAQVVSHYPNPTHSCVNFLFLEHSLLYTTVPK